MPASRLCRDGTTSRSTTKTTAAATGRADPRYPLNGRSWERQQRRITRGGYARSITTGAASGCRAATTATIRHVPADLNALPTTWRLTRSTCRFSMGTARFSAYLALRLRCRVRKACAAARIHHLPARETDDNPEGFDRSCCRGSRRRSCSADPYATFKLFLESTSTTSTSSAHQDQRPGVRGEAQRCACGRLHRERDLRVTYDTWLHDLPAHWRKIDVRVQVVVQWDE